MQFNFARLEWALVILSMWDSVLQFWNIYIMCLSDVSGLRLGRYSKLMLIIMMALFVVFHNDTISKTILTMQYFQCKFTWMYFWSWACTLDNSFSGNKTLFKFCFTYVSLGKLFTHCLCSPSSKLVPVQAGNLNRHPRDTLAPCPWTCSFGWCLAGSYWDGDQLRPMGPCGSGRTLGLG